MAFGLGFNKAKVLSSAEKYVQQGKLQNAISEYEKVLKNDPKDLTVLNTVGDLYARLGQSDQAANCFKSVGDAYAQQGFTVKAIAMYKKLTKMKASLDGILKLAELYTQQGLFNDARQQYLQVAEEFLRSGELEQAVRIFQKTLEMDPENVAMKVRLAEVYIRLKKKDEAWQIFAGAAEQLRSRGQLAPAEDILQRMLTLDPKNKQALLLRGRNSLEAGDSAAAIHYLQQVPDIDSQPEGLKALFQAHLAAEKLAEAGVVATKLWTMHNDFEGISSFVDELIKGGLYRDALNVYHQHVEQFLAADRAKALTGLHAMIGHVRNEPEALQLLLQLFEKAGETTHVAEVKELLAHASVQTGDLQKARDLYQELSSLEPDNPIHSQNAQQVSAKLGSTPGGGLITTEEGVVLADELEATAPAITQNFSEETAEAVRAALTDAELFLSYNMPSKALAPLESVLPQAPEHVLLNQRLTALHVRAGRFAEAATCCRVLQKVYLEAGHQEESDRYGDLAQRCEQHAAPAMVTSASAEGPATSVASAASAPWPGAAPTAAVEEFTLAPPEPVHEEISSAAAADSSETVDAEVDLSDEWEGSVSEAVPEAAPAEESGAETPASAELVTETVEEIRFYLKQSMRLQALAAMAKLEALTKDASLIASLRTEYEDAFAPAPVNESAPVAAPPRAEEIAVEESAFEPAAQEEVPAHASAAAMAAPSAGDLQQLVSDLEADLGDGFGVPPAAPTQVPTPIPAASSKPGKDTLSEFVADLDSSLGDDFLTEPSAPVRPVVMPAPKTAAAAAAAVATPAAAVASVAPPVAATVPDAPPAISYQHAEMASLLAPATAASAAASTELVDMFDELKSELEEDTASTQGNEDPETHYNLGVAFREMGLLDEAIGELQKVCQLVERGHSFPQLMQTYTWLAQCFLDKGVPEAAIRWYEHALQVPAIDQDTRTALHYELASAYESAHNRDSALSHFLQVYGSNIDYRDVAERIKALRS
ncbi:MAG TPA: tetratricopeptide repeat protein [Terriglobales bacterium]|nr:tetratricopeptide repeat protein [Terriglobales bacterium]